MPTPSADPPDPAAAARPVSERAAPRPYTDGQLETLKWIALASMFLDHVGRLALGYGRETWVYAGGRLAFPLFALVLGLKLARPGDRAERAARTALRLGLWCAIAVAPSIWARGEPQLVNVLGTLGLGAVLCWLLSPPSLAAHSPLPLTFRLLLALACALASRHVEFGPPGVLLVAAAWLAAVGHVRVGGTLAALCLLLLALSNAQGGYWPALAGTLAALPVAWAAQRLPLAVPRLRRAFYVVYPVHLALIGAWRAWA